MLRGIMMRLRSDPDFDVVDPSDLRPGSASVPVVDGACLLLMLLFILGFAACGGGSGGGSAGVASQKGGIALASITFPRNLDLSDIHDHPPETAPLSQQVVFTFTGPVKGAIHDSSIMIYGEGGQNYDGPLVLLDASKNIIRTRGSFEVFGNVVVFTPQLPLQEMNLSRYADGDEVPGLLPDTTYQVLVPVGTSGAIANLKTILPDVDHPVAFHTGPLPQLYFSNLPAEAPEVTHNQPKDGRIDFPINNLAYMAGHASFEGIELTFDQPLLPSKDNLQGEDRNQDGIREPNLFLRFSDPRLFVSSLFYKGLVRLDQSQVGEAVADSLIETRFEGQSLGMREIAIDSRGRWTGLLGDTFYRMDPEEGQAELELEEVLETGFDILEGLAFGPEGGCYTTDLATGDLLCFDLDAGTHELIQTLPPGMICRDLAFRHDGGLYLLRLEGEDTGQPLSHLDRIDPDTGELFPCFTQVSGAFWSMTFVDSKTLYLFEYGERNIWTYDLETGVLDLKGGLHVDFRGALDLQALIYEMDTQAHLESNQFHESKVSMNPAGILPLGMEVEIMVRNALTNLAGFSLATEGHAAGASRAVAAFTTLDPGSLPLEDEFFEDFEDNTYECLDAELGLPPAGWNVIISESGYPQSMYLLAGLGHGGDGALGDFEPQGLFPYVIIDTDYQPLPLYDGSTPGVKIPLVVKGGRFDFHNITLPKDTTMVVRGSRPLVLTATGDVVIAGIIDVAGQHGLDDVSTDSGFVPVAGGTGGPGGGRGGRGQPPVPEKFTALSMLQTPMRGETGWDAGEKYKSGGQGGQSGAVPSVPYSGSKNHWDSRGTGGGGGSFLLPGMPGMEGKGEWIPDAQGNPVPQNPPEGGAPGTLVFMDGNPDNDFIGVYGEVDELRGGQGGGGGGSRWDSLNPKCIPSTPVGFPRCIWDSKGGGGGGGGGAVAIHALGTIILTETGKILAMGGDGGGGEEVGASNFAGAGGGGSGGVVILHAGQKIILEESTDPDPDAVGAVIDVSGGAQGDAREVQSSTNGSPVIKCPVDANPKAYYCTLSQGDGGQGGFGLIQLMVDNPAENLVPPPEEIATAKIRVGANVFDADPNVGKGKSIPWDFTYYERVFLTYDTVSYPVTLVFGDSDEFPHPDPDEIVIEHSPLVDPFKTTSTLSSLSYGLSRWIDTGAVMIRPDVDVGMPAPAFMAFRGTDPLTGSVLTESGFVKDHQIPEWNDIVVNAPDLNEFNYIPEENTVAVEFQGAHAAVPGSSVPGEKRSGWIPDITQLNGYQFIRFRVIFDVATQGDMTLDSPRPQVSQLRIRVKY